MVAARVRGRVIHVDTLASLMVTQSMDPWSKLQELE
jgi:hypothetical protein